MSVGIDAHIVQQFTDGITHLQQQKMSRLREAVDVDPKVVGDRAYYNQLGSSSMRMRTSRHGDTVYSDRPHSRRMVTLDSWDDADLLDTDDDVQILTDPTNSYSQSMAMGAGRKTDDVIIDAFFAAASTGKTGTGSESHPGTHQIASSSEGMTISKLLDAKEVLDAYEVEDESRYACMASKQFRNLLATTEVSNADYNSVKALVQGQIDTFLGFKFIRSERLTKVSNDRYCAFWQKDSMKLAIGINPRGRISEMPNKNYSMQEFYEMRIGCTRMDPNGVVRVLADES
jgi:hypothetical protein